ncbi:hypothetical protein [Kitasatospora indigofera]|uniref:hypothetical protein n=1 Tax=Kitasatospora indigofera TaxID=67307 RepID=UPI003676D5C3
METKTMITKLTGQTVAAASLCVAPEQALVALLAAAGLGLDTTVVSVVPVVSALGNTGGSTGAGAVETGLSRDWAMDAMSRDLRDERPTQAPKAAVAAAKHGDYAQVIGAGITQKQNEQLINLAKAAFIGASVIRSRAFRGPEPWRERT